MSDFKAEMRQKAPYSNRVTVFVILLCKERSRSHRKRSVHRDMILWCWWCQIDSRFVLTVTPVNLFWLWHCHVDRWFILIWQWQSDTDILMPDLTVTTMPDRPEVCSDWHRCQTEMRFVPTATLTPDGQTVCSVLSVSIDPFDIYLNVNYVGQLTYIRGFPRKQKQKTKKTKNKQKWPWTEVGDECVRCTGQCQWHAFTRQIYSALL